MGHSLSSTPREISAVLKERESLADKPGRQMMIVSWEIVSVFVLRAGLVALFVPFSVAYMMIDFRGARDHAASAGVAKRWHPS